MHNLSLKELEKAYNGSQVVINKNGRIVKSLDQVLKNFGKVLQGHEKS